MNSLLLVIDMQEAFINESTEHVVEKITNLVNSNEYRKIAFTRFINTKNSRYVKELNFDGCIGEDKKLLIPTKNHPIFNKNIYSALNEELKNYIKENNIDKIYLCGIDTECCILKTSFDLFENGYDFYILKDYCACMFGKSRHKNALEIMERNFGENRII